MALSYVGETRYDAGTGTTENANVAAGITGIQSGDLVFALLQSINSVQNTTAPSPWQLVGKSTAAMVSGYTMSAFAAIYDGSSGTWSFGSSANVTFNLIAFRGGNGITIGSFSTVGENDTDNTTVPWTSVACPAGGAVAALGIRMANHNTNPATPTGYTIVHQGLASITGSTVPRAHTAYHLTPPGAGGTEDPADFTAGGTTGRAMTVLASFSETPATATGPSKMLGSGGRRPTLIGRPFRRPV